MSTKLKYYFNVFPPLETALEFPECTFKSNLNNSDFLQFIQSYGILLFTETWFSMGMKINIDGYKSFHCSRPKYNEQVKSNRGGISVYFKHHISTCISIVKSYEQGIIWIKLDKIFFKNKNEKDYFLC